MKKKVNSKRLIFFIILFFILIGVAIFTLCNHIKIAQCCNEFDIEAEDFHNNVKIPEDKVANIVAIGDTLCHSQNFKDAYDSTTGVYDFSPMFKYVTKYFENATVCVGNCEASFAGPARGYSGYPTFNTPEHLAVDLKELGLDIMTTSNNHTLDMGYNGMVSTLNYLDEAGLEHTGSARSQEEQDKILFKDLNGIKTAFLSFTYGTNGIPVPSGKEYCVNLFADWKSDWSGYTINYDFMKSKIDQAKKEGAEAIVCSMHWGIEYQIKENKEQEKLAEFLIKNDVNVILGCHPHVMQPIKMITVTGDDGVERTGFCIYSMGNFFSAQTFPFTRNTLILNVQIRKDGLTGKISIDNATYTPIYVYDNGVGAQDRYELLDLETIIAEHEADNSKWSNNMYELAKIERKRCVGILGEEIYNEEYKNVYEQIEQ